MKYVVYTRPRPLKLKAIEILTMKQFSNYEGTLPYSISNIDWHGFKT